MVFADAVVQTAAWDPAHGAVVLTATWNGGVDHGTQIELHHPWGEKEVVSQFYLDVLLHNLLVAARPLKPDFAPLFGIELEASVCDLWGDYKKYYRQFRTNANMLSHLPKGVLSFPLASVAQANQNACGAVDDDGLPRLSYENIYQSAYDFLHLHELLSWGPYGSWDQEQLTPDNIPAILRSPLSFGVEEYKLTEEGLMGRNGLKIGDSALRASVELRRGRFIAVYSGTYGVAGQGPAVSAEQAERQFFVPFAGKHKLLITPRDASHLMQYANDVSVDLANKFGKRQCAAITLNAQFFPIELFHFPIILVLVVRDIKKGEEIGVDYGEHFQMRARG